GMRRATAAHVCSRTTLARADCRAVLAFSMDGVSFVTGVFTSRFLAGDLRQEFAASGPVMKGKGQPLEMREELSPEGVDHLVPGARRDGELRIREQSSEEGDHDNGQRNDSQGKDLSALEQSAQERQRGRQRLVQQNIVEDDF